MQKGTELSSKTEQTAKLHSSQIIKAYFAIVVTYFKNTSQYYQQLSGFHYVKLGDPETTSR
jgi:hypothetical protein